MKRGSVLFFVTELGRGGAETQLNRVALRLLGRGWAVTVVSLMPPVGYDDGLRAAGARVISLDLRRGRPHPMALARSVREIRTERPDVVCCFLYHATILGSVASLLAARAPVIASIRDPSFGGRRRLRFAATLHRLGLVRRTVANSETVADALRASGLFRPDDLAVIPNGLELPERLLDERQRGALRTSIGVEPEHFLFLHVGNFQAPKDHPNLLDAFRKLVARRPAARLRLVGLGAPPPDVSTRLGLPALRETVAHLGERSDVPSLLEVADALVLSSSSEGLPNVIMEAHAARTPVISTRVGGVAELVEDGASGLLVAPRDAGALARAMERMMAEPEDVRRAWAARGRAHVEERYELDRVVDRWESLFVETAGNART